MTNGVRQDLIVPLDGIDTTRMLEFWRWLVPDSLSPRFATALGDLFLTDPLGVVSWLDTGTGKLRAVATNVQEFENATAVPETSSYWFGPGLVDELKAAGRLLLPMECYSYLTLPILGGKFEAGNFVINPVVRHFRITGQMHEQIRHLPDGAAVTFTVVE